MRAILPILPILPFFTALPMAALIALLALLALFPQAAAAQGRDPLTQLLNQERYFRDLSVGLPREPITAVATHPKDPEIILAGLDGFVFKTDDGGESWRVVLSYPRGLALQAVDLDPALQAADPTQNFVDPADYEDAIAAEGAGMPEGDEEEAGDFPMTEVDLSDFGPLNADNAGGGQQINLSWPQESPGVRRILFLKKSPGTVYVATPRGLYRSADDGESFTRITLPGGPASQDIRDLAVLASRPSHLFCATAAGFLMSQDGGVFFHRNADLAIAGPALAVAAADLRGGAVVVGAEQGVYRSWDGGKSFTQLLLKGAESFTPVGVVAIDPRQAVTYAGDGRSLYAGLRGTAILERTLLSDQRPLSMAIDPERPGAFVLSSRGRILFGAQHGLKMGEIRVSLPAQVVFDVARPIDDTDAFVVATERGLFQYAPGTGISLSPQIFRQLKKQFAREPTYREVAGWALDYGGLGMERFHATARRVRLAALAPRVDMIFRQALAASVSETVTLLPEQREQLEEQGVDPDNIEDPAVRDALGIGDLSNAGIVQGFFVFARWNLDGLFFPEREMAWQNRITPWRRAEERVTDRLRVIYTTRRRVLVQLITQKGAQDPKLRIAQLIRLAESTALLDGATGGRFSREVAQRGGLELLRQKGIPLSLLTPESQAPFRSP
jgi:hypothetical protein